MGGGPKGPSKSQVRADQNLRQQEMQMQQAMFNRQMEMQAFQAQQQMQQQMEMLRVQQQQEEYQRQQAEQARQDAIAERQRIEEQQRQAAIETQNVSALQLRRQEEAKAQQELASKSSAQQIADQAKLEQERQASLAAGAQATGGGFNLNAARQKALVDLGAMSGTLPSTEANKPQQSNVFALPKTTGLQFGGT